MLKQLSIAAIFIAAASASQQPLASETNLPTTETIASGYRGLSQVPNIARNEFSGDDNVNGDEVVVSESENEVADIAVEDPTKFFGKLSFNSKKSKEESDSESDVFHFKADKNRSFNLHRMPTHYINSKNENKKIKSVKKLSKGKKSLVENEKPFIVSIKRSKSKKNKKSRKSKDATSKGALRFESKKSYILNVSSDIRTGVEVTDYSSTIMKTNGKNARDYVILNGRESHSIALKSSKDKKEGHALLRFEKIRVSSAINGGKGKKKRTYRIVNAPVVMSDAKNVCEMFNYELADIDPEDYETIATAAAKYVKQGRAQLWADSEFVSEAETSAEKKNRKHRLTSGIQIPGVFDINSANLSPYANEISNQIYAAIATAQEAIHKDEKNDSKIRREYREKLQKLSQDFMGKQDPTYRRIVLCRVK